MDLKTKYQYTYFIYPYVVEEKNFSKYLYHLLNNKNCELKIFDKNKDAEIYSYFLPKIRNYMFWSFEYSKNRINKLFELDNKMIATVLSKYPCTIFEYNINKDIQGKTDKNEGIFFNIRKVEIICFNTGVCFLCIKTLLNEDSNFSDLLNFNYKFREIKSSTNNLKNFENIKIQTDTFQDVKGILAFIEDIIGNNNISKNLNIDNERFITYSYSCIGQEYWNDESNLELLDKNFLKFVNVESDKNLQNNNTLMTEIIDDKNIKIGVTKTSNVLYTSDIDIYNYTKLSEKYENEYLYHYIFTLFKLIYLKNINYELKSARNIENTRENFLSFLRNIWNTDITDNNFGLQLSKSWESALNIEKYFEDTKQTYDVIYKNINIEKTAKSNKMIVVILIILLIINIINYLHIFLN